MKIGEAGAGRGYFTFRLAKAVSDDGIIYANDISVRENATLSFYSREFKIRNIVPVFSSRVDPLFPITNLDIIVAYKSFHDFEKKDKWLINVKKYLKYGGKLVIIESYSEHSQLTFCKLKEIV